MKISSTLLLAVTLTVSAGAQTPVAQESAATQPSAARAAAQPVRQLVPPFQALDQFGHEQSLATLMGPKGLVLLFFRSADW